VPADAPRPIRKGQHVYLPTRDGHTTTVLQLVVLDVLNGGLTLEVSHRDAEGKAHKRTIGRRYVYATRALAQEGMLEAQLAAAARFVESLEEQLDRAHEIRAGLLAKLEKLRKKPSLTKRSTPSKTPKE